MLPKKKLIALNLFKIPGPHNRKKIVNLSKIWLFVYAKNEKEKTFLLKYQSSKVSIIISIKHMHIKEIASAPCLLISKVNA